MYNNDSFEQMNKRFKKFEKSFETNFKIFNRKWKTNN